MQALKALVIFLGVLIVVGMGILAYGIMLKFDEWQARKEAEQQAVPAAAGTPVVAEVWTGELEVPVPAGASVAETVVAEGQMIVRLSLPDGGQRYLIFDLGTGKQVGSIQLRPEGNAQ